MSMLDIGTGLYVEDELLRLLAEDMERAKEEDRDYTVVAVVPQRLPGERLDDVVEGAAAIIRNLMRDEDLGGRIDDDIFILGLRDTDAINARVFSYRIQGDLRLGLSHKRSSLWETGMAVLGEDGETSDELLHAAVEAARTRRRRLA